MKRTLLFLLMAASAAIPFATFTTAKSETAPAHSKLPPGVPPVQGPVKSVFALQYQEIKIGTGALAEPNKLYKVQYTYWLAASGQKIDSTYDHPGAPLKDENGKVIVDADGKMKLGPPLTVNFVQGRHSMISGFDQGFEGMRIGGKRRLFIPWQLAYGPLGHPPAIPPQADMIYDVELVDVADVPAPPARPVAPERPWRPAPAQPNGTTPNPGTPAPPVSAAPVQPK